MKSSFPSMVLWVVYLMLLHSSLSTASSFNSYLPHELFSKSIRSAAKDILEADDFNIVNQVRQAEPSMPPRISDVPTPSVTPSATPSATSSSSRFVPTPTASPVRRPEDFIIEKEKTPRENAEAVGTILETEIEKLLDNRRGTTGSDVYVRLKIRQDRKQVNNKRRNISIRYGTIPTQEELESKRRQLVLKHLSNRPAKNCLPFRNCTVRVIVTSEKYIPKKIIERAVNKIRRMPNFGDVFERSGSKTFKIIRKTNRRYLVVVKFGTKFLLEA